MIDLPAEPPTTPDFRRTLYLTAAHTPAQWLPDDGAEVAFAGRSNVGKSSAINAITGRRALARTSKTPGRTQQIVFFELIEQWRLVDLPGYGFARVPAALQRHWSGLLTRYLERRQCLRALLLPVDARRPLTTLDHQMLDFCAELALPLHLLLTKTDKLGRGAAGNALLAARRTIAGCGAVSVQLFSAASGAGVDEARARIIGFLQAPPRD